MYSIQPLPKSEAIIVLPCCFGDQNDFVIAVPYFVVAGVEHCELVVTIGVVGCVNALALREGAAASGVDFSVVTRSFGMDLVWTRRFSASA